MAELISVIVTTYNRADALGAVLRAPARQSEVLHPDSERTHLAENDGKLDRVLYSDRLRAWHGLSAPDLGSVAEHREAR
jgi:hypothetical protein